MASSQNILSQLSSRVASTSRSLVGSLVILSWVVFSQPLGAQVAPGQVAATSGQLDSATVYLDGRPLFEVRGISAFPAQHRAKLIRGKIVEAADDPTFDSADLRLVELDERTAVYAGELLLFYIFDEDAELEQLNRTVLSQVIREKIVAAINDYREDRSGPVLLQNTLFAAGVTAAMAVLFWALLRLFRWLNNWAVRHVQRNIENLADKSHQLIHAGQIWSLVAALLKTLRFVTLAIVLYFFLNTVLGLYPWTRPAAIILFDLVLNPLESLWTGFVSSVPNLVFLVILFFVVRYILRLARAFFRGVERGRIKWENFDPDWAMPTYKILRVLIVAFAVVVAYPYIPGSDSLAFKGVSLFLGVIFSLGSSSFIANMMAGLTMTYRGAFKEGDLVRIGDITGRVEDIKLMITRVRTAKNESVVIPNSNILNTEVTNFSVVARENGIVVHTIVGIGYDTPWRQVEAMLLLAVERTKGLSMEPAPFVLQKSLGDYAINYEINAFCRDDRRMLHIKSDLISQIQDVFNEYGVQIMSPAYEADTEAPKLVPKDKWFEAPAKKPAGES